MTTSELRLSTKSADDTRELAAAVAPMVRAGDTILLAGDLGAGKTAFTQGLGRALGVEQRITSPTFTLMHSYPARGLTLLHVDVYRVDRLQEVLDLGLGELLEEGSAAVIEWGDVAAPALAPDYLEIRIEFGAGDDDRTLVVRAVGSPWRARLADLERSTARWGRGPGGPMT